jgi:hypothetical protein
MMSQNKSWHNVTWSQKVQLYHDILLHILDPLIHLQQANAMPFPQLYRGQHYNLKLKFLLLVVLGDTELHDCLCGCYDMHSIQMAWLCRHCDIPTPGIATVDYYCCAVLVAAGDLTGLKNISQHPIRNAFYDGPTNSRLTIVACPRWQ